MRLSKYIKIVTYLLLFFSTLLNAGLICRLNSSRKNGIDLRHVSVRVGSKPPDVFGVKDLFEEGDKVISIIDTTSNNNAIVMYYRDSCGHVVNWNALIEGTFFCGGVSVHSPGMKWSPE
jgi:hypothetical protein